MSKIGKVIDCDLRIGERYTLQMSNDHVKGLLSELVESYVIRYLMINQRLISKLIYPKITKDNNITVINLKPFENKKPTGQIVKNSRIHQIKGWHGDFVILINSEKYGKNAIIFEIKLGRVMISKAQRAFFKAVKEDPGKYLKGLQQVKTYLVRLGDLDLKNNTIKVFIQEYNPTKHQKNG